MNHGLVVYEWLAWEGFIITRLFPGCVRIQGRPFDEAQRILEAVPPGSRHFLFHINCTRTDKFVGHRAHLMAALNSRGITVLNGAIVDISKRTLQKACAALGLNSTAADPNGPRDEPLIVKTALNSYGFSEHHLTPAERAGMDVQTVDEVALLAELDEPLRTELRALTDYLVLPRESIPKRWWGTEQLVVERFIGNPHDRIYRAWLLRDRLTIAQAVCAGPVKKLDRASQISFHHFQITGETYERLGDRDFGFVTDLIRLRTALHVDYGAFDVVEDRGGRYFVIDINTTPGVYVASYDEELRYLSGALGDRPLDPSARPV